MPEIKRQRSKDTPRHGSRSSRQGRFNCFFLTIAVTQTQTPCLRDGEMKVVMLSVQQGTTRQALPSL